MTASLAGSGSYNATSSMPMSGRRASARTISGTRKPPPPRIVSRTSHHASGRILPTVASCQIWNKPSPPIAAAPVPESGIEPAPGRVFDVVMQGTVFLDIVLTGLNALPTVGTEVPAEGMGSCPGSIANLAIAASRLGLRTSLCRVVRGRPVRRLPGQHAAATRASTCRCPGGCNKWHSPVTVSLAVHRDRAMITHSHPSPIPDGTLIPRGTRYRSGRGASRAGGAGIGYRLRGAGAPCCSVTSDRGTPTEQWSSRHAGTDASAERFPAQQRGGDGLHPDRRPKGRAHATGRRGAGGGDHLRRAGFDRRGFHHRGRGVDAVAAGERRRRHRSR